MLFPITEYWRLIHKIASTLVFMTTSTISDTIQLGVNFELLQRNYRNTESWLLTLGVTMLEAPTSRALQQVKEVWRPMWYNDTCKSSSPILAISLYRRYRYSKNRYIEIFLVWRTSEAKLVSRFCLAHRRPWAWETATGKCRGEVWWDQRLDSELGK